MLFDFETTCSVKNEHPAVSVVNVDMKVTLQYCPVLRVFSLSHYNILQFLLRCMSSVVLCLFKLLQVMWCQQSVGPVSTFLSMATVSHCMMSEAGQTFVASGTTTMPRLMASCSSLTPVMRCEWRNACK